MVAPLPKSSLIL